MIELKNSKKTFLGKVSGRNRFALDCYIGACQYKDNLGKWQDIAPKLVKVGNKYVSQGTPYLMEFDNQGGRREYPDRYDLSKYISLPAIPLVRNLPRKVLKDRIVFTAPKFDLTMGLGKTGTFLTILFREAPAFDRIAFNADLVGLDVLELLASKEGLGIPRPRLIDSSEEPIERMLDWSFENGQLEAGFDMTGLKFPILFKNSPLDVQVGASTDDADEVESTGVMALTGASVYLTANTLASGRRWAGFRFVSAGFPAQGTTIDVAYLRVYLASTSFDDANINIHFEELAAPATFTTTANDITSRDRTESSTPWVADGIAAGGVGWFNSPDFSGVGSPIQELFDGYSPTTIVLITRPNQDADKAFRVRSWNSTAEPLHSYAAILHLEWTAGGEEFFQVVGAGAMSIGGGTGADVSLLKYTKLTSWAAGSMAIAGASTKGMYQAVGAASMNIAGALERVAKKIVGSASITITGALSIYNRFYRSIGGASLTIAGTLTKFTKVSMGAGSMTIAGALTKLTETTIGGASMAIASSLTKTIKMTIGEGAVVIAGALTKYLQMFRAVGSASMTVTGAATKKLFQAIGGASVTIAGSVVKETSKTMGQASMTIAGALAKYTKVTLSVGSIAITGSLSTASNFYRAVGAGSMAIVGTVRRSFLVPLVEKGRWLFPTRYHDPTDKLSGYEDPTSKISGYEDPKTRWKYPSDYE